MNITITGIRSPGELNDERLIMRVLSPVVEVGRYAVFRAEVEDESVTTNVSNVFWFPDGTVKKGDLVVLYTKNGVQKERVNKDGSTSHFYYWGMKEPFWNDPKFVAVLVQIDQWSSTVKLGDDQKSAAAS
jgi:hypothetical protein